MSTKYKVRNNELPHFVTFSVVNWIDALTRQEYKEIIIESLQYCIKEKGFDITCLGHNEQPCAFNCYVRQEHTISDILRDLKKFTSKQIVKAIKENSKESRKEWMIWMFERAGKRNINNKEFQFWQQDNHPIELSNSTIIKQRLNYLHENPVRAAIVYEAQDYIYSSAIDYYTNKKGRITVEFL